MVQLGFTLMNVATNWRESVVWVLKVNFIVVFIDVIILLIWLLLQTAGVVTPVRKDFFAILLLAESGIIFLTGGAIAMSATIFSSKIREYFFRSKEAWSAEKHRKTEARANLYILAGILLFLESVGLALFL